MKSHLLELLPAPQPFSPLAPGGLFSAVLEQSSYTQMISVGIIVTIGLMWTIFLLGMAFGLSQEVPRQ